MNDDTTDTRGDRTMPSAPCHDTTVTGERPPSTPFDALLRRALDGDRDGAAAALAAGGLPKYPGGGKLMAALLAAVPARTALPREVVVDRGESLLVTAPGERGTCVVFTGHGERVWLDLPVFDAFLARAGYRGIYLRDPAMRLYTDGIPDHPGHEAFRAFLAGVRAAEPRELVYLGTSSGGFGAIWWACDVAPDRTLAFSPATSAVPSRLAAIGEDRALMLEQLMPPGGGPDLRERLRETGHAGRIDVHYGADAPLDRAHAAHLDLPGVRRIPYPEWEHHQLLLPMAAYGHLAGILADDEDAVTVMRRAIAAGDVDGFVACCRGAIAAGDRDALRVAMSTLRTLPRATAAPVLRELRTTYPELLADRAAYVDVARTDDELPPSSVLQGALRRAIAGDRAGAMDEVLRRTKKWDAAYGSADRVRQLIDTVPARAELPRDLVRDHGEDVLVSAPGERGTLVMFCGLSDAVAFDLPVFDAWVARAGYRGIYLRDRARLLYRQGVDGIGGGRDGLVAWLDAQLAARDGETVFAGASVGGLGAVDLACALGADRTLLFATPASTRTAHLRKVGETRSRMLEKRVAATGIDLDIAERLRACAYAGRVDWYFGGDMPVDRAHAECVDVPGVARHPIAGFAGHQVLVPLAWEGRLVAVLQGTDGAAA